MNFIIREWFTDNDNKILMQESYMDDRNTEKYMELMRSRLQKDQKVSELLHPKDKRTLSEIMSNLIKT